MPRQPSLTISALPGHCSSLARAIPRTTAWWLGLALVWLAITGCGATQPVSAHPPQIELPAALEQALTREYGRYDAVVSWQEFLRALASADIVCIGEAHYDPRDMETAFEIVRELSQRRRIALAVERFSYDLQPQLDAVHQLEGAPQREAGMKDILNAAAYQTVWGTSSWNQKGFPVNTPSQPSFEAMVSWAARAGIPLIALDVTLADRAAGLGEKLVYRNELWKTRVLKFLQTNAQSNYLVVVVGGIDHIHNSPGSATSKLRASSQQHVLAIGQRDAMYQLFRSPKLETLAKVEGIGELIVRAPEFAVVNRDGAAAYPHAADYWIGVHQPVGAPR